MESRWNDGSRFAGRSVIVTGGSGALGGATAKAFAREGARASPSPTAGAAMLRRPSSTRSPRRGGEAVALPLDLGRRACRRSVRRRGGRALRHGRRPRQRRRPHRCRRRRALRPHRSRRLGRAVPRRRQGHDADVRGGRAAHARRRRRCDRQLLGQLRQRGQPGEPRQLRRRPVLRGEGSGARVHRRPRPRSRSRASASTRSRRGRSRPTGKATGASRPSTSPRRWR